jgi:hypothetical protein
MKRFGEPEEMGGARAAYVFDACPFIAVASVYGNAEMVRSRPRRIRPVCSGRDCRDEVRFSWLPRSVGFARRKPLRDRL